MVRKLALAVAIALGSTSMSALGLGLGDIKAKSVLNQTLNADIRLLSVGKGELDGLRVKLASSSAFERAGVDRAYFLSQLKFNAEKRGGHHVINVTSDFPIREPFLNFLVEVNWPKGRLVREYTLLLDPPTTTGRRAPQVSATETAARTTTPAVAKPAPRPPAKPRVSAAPAVRQYGPVRANDTLWAITEKVKHSGVGHMQMMMSLFQANPSAFVGDNVNNLRKGQILRIPDRDEVLSLSRAKAQAMWRAQKESWLADRAPAGAPKAPEVPAKVEDLPLAVTRTVPPTVAAPGQDGQPRRDKKPAPDGQLRIAAPRPEGEGEAGVGETEDSAPIVAELNEKLLLARENAESTRLEAAQLRQRVDDLHAQLRDMQRLLTLKDDQLAQLQKGLADADGFEGDGTEEKALDVARPEAADGPETETADVVMGADDATAADGPDAADGEEIAFDAAGEAVPADEDELAIGAGIDEAADTTVAGVVNPPVSDGDTAGVTPDVASGAEAQPNWFAAISDKLTRSGGVPLIAAAVAGVVALGALFGVVLSRRRRKAAEAAFDQEFDGLSANDYDTQVGTAAPADTSTLSDFAAGDTESLPSDTTDVDPVSEADVYIAYGRYQQAEQMLRQSMDKDPDRLALPHKLLEVYYATRKPAAFVGLAGEMMADGRDRKDPRAWDRVKEMGRELAPDNPIFTAVAGSATVASFAEAAQARGQASSRAQDDIGLSELASGFTLDMDAETIDDDTENLDLTKELEGLSRELEAGGLDDDDSVPLHELESLELDFPETASVGVTGNDGVLQFQDRSSKEQDTADPNALQAELDELSDLSSFEVNMPGVDDIGEAETPTQLHDVVLDIEDDKKEEDLMLDTADQGSMFGEEDVATKLELARAYVDMGDEEGARSILAEVQEEGSAEQKGLARELLQKLGT